MGETMWWSDLVLKSSPEAGKTLAEKSKEFADHFSFPSERHQKDKIAESLCDVLRSGEQSGNHVFCLELVRVLSRDPAGVDELLSDDLMKQLLAFSGLHLVYQESQSLDFVSNFNETLEAQKALSNAIFQSEKARRTFLKLLWCCLFRRYGGLESLASRLRLHSSPNLSMDFEMKSYDVRLFFIITATSPDVRGRAGEELGGIGSLTAILSGIMAWSGGKDSLASVSLTCQDSKMIIEVLKALFNLTMGLKSLSISEATLAECDKLCSISRMVVLGCRDMEMGEEVESLRTNIVNLLTTLPYTSYSQLTPPLEKEGEGEPQLWVYDGHDMRVLDELLDFLEKRCDKPARVQRELLHPILFLLCELARGSPRMRKYMKMKVLPPLRNEVMRPPEEGNSVRNKVVKLMTSVTEIKDAAAEFLYVLCKKNVDRLIKYTGFGNAAGHLANYGLMGGFRRPEPDVEDSPDEDSDTEEYRSVKDQVNPVLGCFEPPRPDPMEGMSEEQKEFEAMKLVEQINKLMDSGIIKPATVGEDGRVRPLEHVLELREANGATSHPDNEEEEGSSS